MQAAFDQFDYQKIACYRDDKIAELLENPGIIRSRKKIEAIIHNAKCFLKIQEAEGSFSKYLWSFVNGAPQRYPDGERNRPYNELSEQISTDLKKRGFKFLGRVTTYSHLQAAGIINDHDAACFKSRERQAVKPAEILGSTVLVAVDRPLGSVHPSHPDIVYPVNYGYVPGILGGDGEAQDVYLLGVDQPVPSCRAVILAVVHRKDDNEDKWIAAPERYTFSKEAIWEQVWFQEQYFDSELIMVDE